MAPKINPYIWEAFQNSDIMWNCMWIVYLEDYKRSENVDEDNLERFLATTKAVAIAALAHQWQSCGQPRTEEST